MKLLPDYIIEYMPDVEDAVEELRLSVIDHAYELIQSLDIDELTANNIREKLALWDIKTENMSNEWLPNGRFYRIYAAINHHRTRLNTLKSIAKSDVEFKLHHIPLLHDVSFTLRAQFSGGPHGLLAA